MIYYNSMKKKKALITGINGQDGAYLSKLLLDKGYKVYGTCRRSTSERFTRLKILGVFDKVHLYDFDLLEVSNIQKIIKEIMPDEIYNLAAQSFVPSSFTVPIVTADINALGTLRILDAIHLINKKIKFYQASTSEMFGKVKEIPQNESTPFHPRSPYGVSKLFAHWITINYRESYNMYACCGILFNHESPLRGDEFVTKKITSTLSNIKNGSNEILNVGNIYAKRDWGFAGDYVEAMWLMLQQKKVDDYVISTGNTYLVKDFIDLTLTYLKFDYKWIGKGLEQRVINNDTGKTLVKINKKFFRPAEVDLLIGNSNKAKKKLKWKPKTSIKKLVKLMVDHDLNS
jgi:GDPmannose 4,6-dehydratase